MRMTKHLPAALFAITALTLAHPAKADDSTRTIDQWYQALQAADKSRLGTMLAKDAEIVLKDLDITQSRADFLGSMDDWALSIEGGALRHKIQSNNDGVTIVEVCYDFTENDILMREHFTWQAGKIIRQEQQQLANKC